MRNFLKGLIVAGALFGAGLVEVGAANALPIAPAVAAQTATAPVETVGWRCGPGWHVNPWGRCVPNRRVYRPYYGGGGYRRGFYHRGYYGRGFHRGYYHRRRW